MDESNFIEFLTFTLSNKQPAGIIQDLSLWSSHFKKECLWVFSNIVGAVDDTTFGSLLKAQHLIGVVCELAHSSDDLAIRKEALIAIHNMCECNNQALLPAVMTFNPQEAYFNILAHYQDCDPYTLQIALSFCSLICEKYQAQAVQSLIQANIIDQIENIKYIFSDNTLLVQMVNSLLETYIYKAFEESD